MVASPGGRLNYYRLLERPGDAAMIHVIGKDRAPRDLFVSPHGEVLGARDPAAKISETIARIHGSLLIGTRDDWQV